MSINKIALKNFKCFKETEINLSKITLLTGANSSGKSSLLYAILAIFQSKDFPFYFSPNGKYVNMGDFEEIVFNHQKDSKIEIEVLITEMCSGEYFFKTSWAINDLVNKMPALNYLKGEFITEKFYYEIWKKDNSYLLKIHCYSKEKYEKESIVVEDFQFENSEALIKEVIKAGRMFKINCTPYLFNIDNTFFNFLSSFRLKPERTYYQIPKADKIGIHGEGYLDQILEWANTKSEKFKELIFILKELGLLQTIKIQRLQGGRFELRVKTQKKGIWASLTDVGFGISHFLPIIVADLQLEINSTLLIEQPELHLHPSVQATLADYFIRQATTQGKQYIIETHSEYLLNRIRLAIVKEEIAPSDISVYFFENSPEGTITHEIEFTKDGQIKNAPQGFFETYMLDVMNIAMYA